MTKRACNDAGSTSDAKIFVDGHPIIISRLPVAGLGRTHLHAVRFFTVIADHRKVDPNVLPFYYFDTGATRVA
jgi:hypothetical protein